MTIGLPFYSQVLMVLIDLIAVWLAIIGYLYIPKKKLRWIFLTSIFFMLNWVNFAYVARVVGRQTPVLGEIFLKVAWTASPLLFISIYFLAVFYLEKEKQYAILNKIVLVTGVVAALVAGFTNLIVSGIRFVGADLIDLTIIYGKGMVPFLGLVAFFMCATIYILFREYAKSLPERRKRITYLLAGIFVFYIANIIFGIISPIFFNFVRLYWIGDYSSIVLLSFIAYALIKRELFGARVILTAALVGIIAILLILDMILFTTDFMFQLYKSLVIVVFFYFGYLLIRSVLREIEYREKVAKAYALEKKARQEIQQLTDAKTQFIMATQHHLRTPLTSMIGYLDLLFGGTYGKVPPKIKNTLMKFQVSTRRLIRVVNALLDISQFQMGKQVVSLEPGVSFDSLISEVMEELQFEGKTRGLYLEYKPVNKNLKIKADQEKLKVAMFNIIDNAIKYTKQGGITVTLKKNNDKAQLAVKDTGMGIEPEQAKKLFKEVFARGKEAKKAYGMGRGIGVYVTGHIIRAHNGNIWAESEGKGKGATFYIELPL